MASDNSEREEIDRLVKDLVAGKVPPPPTPVVVPQPQPAVQPPAEDHQVPARGRRWSTARLLMPEAARTKQKETFAFASAISLPAMPRLSLPTMPRIGMPALTEAQWDVITARMFVGLGVVLSVMMPSWPYANSCSWGLWLYLAAVLLVIVTGVWAAKLSWDDRLGASHTISLGIVLWGLMLAAAEILPRIGYAQQQAGWYCA